MVVCSTLGFLRALKSSSVRSVLLPYPQVLPCSTSRQQFGHLSRPLHNNNTNSNDYKLVTPPDVKIVEVGPRDGLQNERKVVSVQDKVELIKRLVGAGCPYIETGSFVSPKWVPTMANSLEVMQSLQQWRSAELSSSLSSSSRSHDVRKNVTFASLVPNLTGLEMAIQAGVDEIAIFGSASEAFSQKNINCSIAESMERFQNVVNMAKQHNLPVRGYLSCAIACPYQGPVAPSTVATIAKQMLDLGCYELSLGDTIGVGTPASTLKMLAAVASAVGNETQLLAVHFHDTYGQALANILVSMECGIATVDASVAGLGGCPYAKGASGNVATEDVIYMLNGLGVTTGIDLEKLAKAGEFISGILEQPTRSKTGAALAAKAM